MQSWHLDMPRAPTTSSASWSNQQAVRLPNITPEQPQLFALSSALVSTFSIPARPLIALPPCHGPAAGSAALTCCSNCGKPSHSQAGSSLQTQLTSVNCHLQSRRHWSGVQHMGTLLSEHLLSHSSVCTSIHQEVTIYNRFFHARILLLLPTPLSFGEGEWLQIYWKR